MHVRVVRIPHGKHARIETFINASIKKAEAREKRKATGISVATLEVNEDYGAPDSQPSHTGPYLFIAFLD